MQGLEVLDVPLRIGIHEHAGVENALGVQQFLDGLHYAVGGRAPLHFDKGGDVAARAVFGLEGTVVFFGDKLAEVVHKGRITRHFRGRSKVLPENEMQVAVPGVTEQGGHCVPVAGKQVLQVCGGFAQTLKGKGHVFNNNGGAHRAHAAHRGQDALTDQPEFAVFFGLVGKRVRPHEFYVLEGGVDGGDVFVQVFLGRSARLHQQGTDLVVKGVQPIGQAGGALHGAQRSPVHKLGGGNGQSGHCGSEITGILDRGQQHEGRCLERRFFNGAVGHFGDEAQGAFRTHHEMLQDFKGIFVINQGVDAVARGVFDFELAADAVCQGCVAHDLVSKSGQAVKDVAVCSGKGRAAFGVGGVQQGAV